MKHAAAWLVALALLAPKTFAGTSEMTTEETINDAVSTMTQTLMKGQIDAVVDIYEPGALVLFEPGQAVSDRDALAQGFAMFAGLKPRFDYPQGHESYVAGDIALHIAPWSMEGTLPDGQAMTQSGLSVSIWRLQPDGDWKMIIDNPHGARLLSN